MNNKDVIVIGAGVIGSAIALALCRRGYRTLNIDKNPPPVLVPPRIRARW